MAGNIMKSFIPHIKKVHSWIENGKNAVVLCKANYWIPYFYNNQQNLLCRNPIIDKPFSVISNAAFQIWLVMDII